eukprot:UN08538
MTSPALPNTICVNVNITTTLSPTAPTTEDPTKNPTKDPTFEPTIEPTLEPTLNIPQANAQDESILTTPITSATYSLNVITGEYYLTNNKYIKPACNDNDEVYLYWGDEKWQIGMNTNNSEYIAICDEAQLNGSSPVECGNYLMEDETSSFVSISNGACAINECQTVIEETDYIVWIIIGTVGAFILCIFDWNLCIKKVSNK